MNNRASLGLIILLITFLVLVVVGVVVYIYSSPPPVVDELVVNVSFFNVYVSSNALSPVFYSLFNGSSVLVSGVLLSQDVVEEFKGVPSNSSVVLSAWSDKYYFNSSVCNVSVNNSYCFVGLDKKALDYELLLSDRAVSVFGVVGVVKDSVLCFAWGSSVVDVWADLSSASVPIMLRGVVDKCFFLGSFSGNLLVPVVVRRNTFFSTSSLLKVFLLDFEVAGHSIIGLRNTSLMIES